MSLFRSVDKRKKKIEQGFGGREGSQEAGSPSLGIEAVTILDGRENIYDQSML